MPFKSGPIIGRQALTMAMQGSIVDQMSASTAVPAGWKAGQREGERGGGNSLRK